MEKIKGFFQKLHPTRIPIVILFLIIAILLFYNIVFRNGDVFMEHIKLVMIMYGVASAISGLIAVRMREFAYTRDLVFKDMPAVAFGVVNIILGIFFIWIFYYVI